MPSFGSPTITPLSYPKAPSFKMTKKCIDNKKKTLSFGQSNEPKVSNFVNNTSSSHTNTPSFKIQSKYVNKYDIQSLIPKGLALDIDILKSKFQSMLTSMKENNEYLEFPNEIKFNNTIEVSGVSTFKDNVLVDGTSTFNNNIEVSGVSTFKDNVLVDGTSTFNNNIEVSGVSTFKDNVLVDGTSTFNNNIEVSGVSTFKDNVLVDGTSTFNNDVEVSGVSTFKNNVLVDGTSTFNNDVEVSGVSTFKDSVLIDGTPTFCGDVVLKGKTTMNDLEVSGKSDFLNNIEVLGKSTINGIEVNGTTAFNNDIQVNGTTAFNNEVQVNDSITFKNEVQVNGTTAFNNEVQVNGTTTFNNEVQVNGTTTFSNDVEATHILTDFVSGKNSNLKLRGSSITVLSDRQSVNEPIQSKNIMIQTKTDYDDPSKDGIVILKKTGIGRHNVHPDDVLQVQITDWNGLDTSLVVDSNGILDAISSNAIIPGKYFWVNKDGFNKHPDPYTYYLFG